MCRVCIMRGMPKSKTVSEALVRLVAGFSGSHVQTCRKFLAGEPVKGAALRERLEAAKKRAEAALSEEAPKRSRKAARS